FSARHADCPPPAATSALAAAGLAGAVSGTGRTLVRLRRPRAAASLCRAGKAAVAMKRSVAWWLCGALLLAFLLELGSGASALSLPGALADLWQGRDSVASLILVELRLPRALLALLV